MKNTLTIKIEEQCSCECLDSIFDGSNSIFVSIHVPNETNPILSLSDGTTRLLNPKQLNIVEIASGDFSGLENDILTFQYISDERTGSTFNIIFPDKLEGNMMLKRIDDYTYKAQFTKYGSSSGSGSGSGSGSEAVIPDTIGTIDGEYITSRERCSYMEILNMETTGFDCELFAQFLGMNYFQDDNIAKFYHDDDTVGFALQKDVMENQHLTQLYHFGMYCPIGFVSNNSNEYYENKLFGDSISNLKVIKFGNSNNENLLFAIVTSSLPDEAIISSTRTFGFDKGVDLSTKEENYVYFAFGNSSTNFISKNTYELGDNATPPPTPSTNTTYVSLSKALMPKLNIMLKNTYFRAMGRRNVGCAQFTLNGNVYQIPSSGDGYACLLGSG